LATEHERNRLRAEVQALRQELLLLEKALPPHGLKPEHLRRIEALEDEIEEKNRALANLDA